jgi:SAM-dependent methyltransferase
VPKPDVGAVFDAADPYFAVLAPVLWDPMGRATVARADPRPGERVLDVCCGTGASAIPAAHAVGPTGHVDAIDLSARLLAQGRAAAPDLTQLHFTQADATTWSGAGGAGYDVLQCVYGVFFLPDMDADYARLVTLVRPGGRVVVTTWARGSVMPVPELLAEAVQAEGADVPAAAGRGPVERIETEEQFHAWMTGLGLRDVTIVEQPHRMPLDADRAWALVMGSALRLLLTGVADVDRVRTRFLDLLVARQAHDMNAVSLIGMGRTAE